jgi:DNA-binding response OmpR family regulator
MRVLVVEDELDMAAALKKGLERHGFAVDLATNGEAALVDRQNSPYDSIVLDRRLPSVDGLTVCSRLRAAGSTTPILMLTALDAVSDRVDGLNAGADDYLTKPFDFTELVARLRALVRRSSGLATNLLTVRDLALDGVAGTVARGGRVLTLTHKEFSLLAYLMRHVGQVIAQDRLLAHAWDDAAEVTTETLRVHIKNLRRKVDGGAPVKLVRTVHGRGYVVGP